MNSDWQNEMNLLLKKIEANTRGTLADIKKIFQRSGMKFDERFRKHFLDILNNR